MKFDLNDTIVAPATLPGTGAITVIRMSGPDSFSISDKVLKLASGTVASSAANTIRFGSAHYPDGQMLDEVLVSIFRSPHSYTGEDSVEISCHASAFIAEELVLQLCNAGARTAEPGEFTRRAYVNGKMDLAQAEAVADIIASSNSASLRVAVNQLKGGYSKELSSIRESLLEMTSLLELELDFSEEDVEFADRSKLLQLLDSSLGHIHSLTDSFRYGNAIRNGVPVAIVGATNSGKSTLLNALVGEQRAIVSDIAGTTRDTVEEMLNIEGHLFRIIDTAGLRETTDRIEIIGIERSYSKLSQSSIVLAMVDLTSDAKEIGTSISDVVSHIDFSYQKLFILANKTDISGANKNVSVINKIVSEIDYKVTVLEISANTGKGLDKLKKSLVSTQFDSPMNSGQTIVTNLRHFEALRNAASALESVRKSLINNQTPDLLAEDLRQAIHHMSTILGDVTPDEVLGLIFSRFCIGK
ncbi:MAG: tRNA uridine-5-carboxymethylaminomethyl(34) synthesis GTPase MnmE [Candidatus Cryptobacteroides sp.]